MSGCCANGCIVISCITSGYPCALPQSIHNCVTKVIYDGQFLTEASLFALFTIDCGRQQYSNIRVSVFLSINMRHYCTRSQYLLFGVRNLPNMDYIHAFLYTGVRMFKKKNQHLKFIMRVCRNISIL